MRQRIYVAGPLNSSGDKDTNIANACRVGGVLHSLGHTPFVPHINVLWHEHHPLSEHAWLAWDLEWLAMCDWLVRLPGVSPGSDIEVATARATGKSILFLSPDPAEWADELARVFGDD
jgi:hypothetical protein